MPSTQDVIILGGGPAGVSAALTLRQFGHSATIVEKEPFPRFHIGESLLPQGMALLRELGIYPRIAAEGFIVKPGVRFYSRADGLDVTLRFIDAPLGATEPTAFQVERERYDEILLDAARDAGVHILSPALATQVVTTPAEVEVSIAEGSEVLRAPVLIDCTGQQSLCSRQLGLRQRIPKLLTHAYFGYFRGLPRRDDADGGNITVCFLPGGWIWYIPLRDDVTSVGVVLLDSTVRPPGGPDQVLLGYLEAFLPQSDIDLRERLISEVRAYGAINFCSTRYVSDRILLAGDAAAFLDPVFSTGVFIGMWAGREAAKTASSALKSGDFTRAAMIGYEREFRVLHHVSLDLVDLFYQGRFKSLLTQVRPDRPGIGRDIMGLLSGNLLDPNNSLSQVLRRRAQDVPLTEA